MRIAAAAGRAFFSSLTKFDDLICTCGSKRREYRTKGGQFYFSLNFLIAIELLVKMKMLRLLLAMMLLGILSLSRPVLSVCMSQLQVSRKTCEKRIRNCRRNGLPTLKYVTTKPTCFGIPKETGCLCTQFCGYTCEANCRGDNQCFWNGSQCLNKASGVAGTTFSAVDCTITSAPSKSPTVSSPSIGPSYSTPSMTPSTSTPTSSPSRSPSTAPSTSLPSTSPSTSAPSKSPTTRPSRSPSKLVRIAGNYTEARLSGDGNYLVAGDYQANNNFGAAFVYVRSGYSWSLQQTLTDGSSSYSYFASYVAINNDGTYIALAISQTRQVAIFVRDVLTNIWTRQQLITLPKTAYALDFDSTGATLIVAASSNPIVTYIYVRSDLMTYSLQQQLFPTGTSSGSPSAVLSASGLYALTRVSPFITSIFYYNGSSWTEQGQLTNSDKTTGFTLNRIGTTCINQDGSIALISVNNTVAWKFTRSGTTWSSATVLNKGGPCAMNLDGSSSLIYDNLFTDWTFTSSKGVPKVYPLQADMDNLGTTRLYNHYYYDGIYIDME